MVQKYFKKFFTILQKKQTTSEELSIETDVLAEKLATNNLNWQNVVLQPSLDSALHLVCRIGHVDLLSWLLKNGATNCLEQQNRDGKTPLHEAAQNTELLCVELLIQEGANANPLNRGDWTPLMLACTKHSDLTLTVVKTLVNNGADDRLLNKDGWNTLHIAARSATKETVEFLLRNNSDSWNNVSNNKRNILHTAALHNRSDLFLLFKSLCTFSIISTDSCGNTPFMEACKAGHVESAKLLIKLWPECDLLQTDMLGRSVLQVTCEAGETDAVTYLINECNQDPKRIDNAGQSCLHNAAREGHCSLIRTLVEKYNCDITVEDKYGRNAAWMAKANKRQHCYELLTSLSMPT